MQGNFSFNTSFLLEKAKQNREKHIAEYEEAVEEYRKQLENAFEKRLKALRNGEDVSTYVNLPKPESYENHYDTAIDMLENTTAEVVNIDATTYNRIVRDEWEWTQSFKSVTSNYKNSF